MLSKHPLSVLVVEDGEDAAQSTAELLTLHGHTVRVAHRGPEALRAAAAEPPDVVLLDIGLPGMDGWEVAERLRHASSNRRPFVVAVTGRGMEADRQRSAEAGVDLHLIKPVEPGLLVWALSRAPRVITAPAPPPPPAAVRILLVDDHAVVRAGLRAVVAAEPDMAVVAEAANGPAALALAAELNPDVVVADISMPGLNGAQVTERLRAADPGRKVLALTVHEDAGYVRQLLAAGAAGYMLKRTAAAELVRAIRAVAAGGTYLDSALAVSVIDGSVQPTSAAPEPELSERETEVVRRVALGYSNKEIAARLKLSVKTVETYKTRSMEKLGMHSRVDIVRYAAEHGWLKAT